MENTHRELQRTPRQRFADIEECLRWNFGQDAEPAILALHDAITAMDAQQSERLRAMEQAAKLERQRAIKSEAWAVFLANWLDYYHGSGESDRAHEEFVVGKER